MHGMTGEEALCRGAANLGEQQGSIVLETVRGIANSGDLLGEKRLEFLADNDADFMAAARRAKNEGDSDLARKVEKIAERLKERKKLGDSARAVKSVVNVLANGAGRAIAAPEKAVFASRKPALRLQGI